MKAGFIRRSSAIRYNRGMYPHASRVSIILLFLLSTVTPSAAAQATSIPPRAENASTRLRVFLDCDQCFSDFIRSEIDWVDFVRQPQDADVTLLASNRSTGSGGREYILRLVGKGRFLNVDREYRAVSMTGDPEDLRRAGVLDAVMVGLLGYLAIDGLPSTLDLSLRSGGEDPGAAAPIVDPWNRWVFQLRAGGQFQAEETNREVRWNASISADRVTEAWKISFGTSIDERTERFDLDEEESFEVTRGNRELEWFVAKSLGPHWSVGLDGRVSASDFGNVQFSSRVSPALEFSVFPYRDYASKQLLIQYRAGAEHVRYNEVTFFDKTRETLASHRLSTSFNQRQPWGSLRGSVEFSQYLHDLSKYRLELDTDVSVRLFRGLSVGLEASASRIHDQLSLPRRGATPEEVLLRLRQLQSSYEMDFQVNLTYSFGSLFNSVVNPRFGGGGGGGGRGRGR